MLVRKPEKKSFTFVDFIFRSQSAFWIVSLNIIVFSLIRYQGLAKETVYPWVLYPGNLLSGKMWCLLSSGFIHFELSHLLVNMLGVFIFANVVEKHLGALQTIFVYLTSLIISMLFATVIYTFVLQKNTAIIGASGAVMGLLAAAMLLDPFRITYEMIIPLPVMVKGWMFIYADVEGFLAKEVDGVSHLAHLCGFLSIAVIVYILTSESRKIMRTGLIINVLSFVVFLLIRDWIIHQGYLSAFTINFEERVGGVLQYINF
ncbi:MAG: rhomboid family intramembrane serine protease [Candidatus Omnitrophica bacterium]|nr:rhomboid family intramembrane serine protease [Candidatus Omnitrophota bacterium]